MVSINYALREISCKIVYYGPGLSGKTTNLQFVHGKVPAPSRGELISLATEADRTLYFDFLPVDVGKIAGFDTKFQLYTVPGQVFYDATRRLVLRGVDGLVFVADSQSSKMDENIESLSNMYDNLKSLGINTESIPLVFQWNKRDLPDVLPVAILEEKLNPRRFPSFEAVATTGTGVFETLKQITKMVLENARSRASSRAPVAVAPRAAATPTPAASATERETVPVGATAAPLSAEKQAVGAAPVGRPAPVAPQGVSRQRELAPSVVRPVPRQQVLRQPGRIHREPSRRVRDRGRRPKSKSFLARFFGRLFGT